MWPLDGPLPRKILALPLVLTETVCFASGLSGFLEKVAVGFDAELLISQLLLYFSLRPLAHLGKGRSPYFQGQNLNLISFYVPSILNCGLQPLAPLHWTFIYPA